MRTIRTLTPPEFGALRDHLLRLDAEDRRLRFGCAVSDDGIAAAVGRLGAFETCVLAAHDDALRVIAAVQITRAGAFAVECAFSVEPAHRRRGLGTELMRRAILWARNRGVVRVHVHCLRENHGMRRIAVRFGMAVGSEAGETDAVLVVLPPDPASLWSEIMGEAAGIGGFVHAAARHAARRLRSPPEAPVPGAA